jgi:hypothetical protein
VRNNGAVYLFTPERPVDLYPLWSGGLNGPALGVREVAVMIQTQVDRVFLDQNVDRRTVLEGSLWPQACGPTCPPARLELSPRELEPEEPKGQSSVPMSAPALQYGQTVTFRGKLRTALFLGAPFSGDMTVDHIDEGWLLTLDQAVDVAKDLGVKEVHVAPRSPEQFARLNHSVGQEVTLTGEIWPQVTAHQRRRVVLTLR